jgi:D-alanyl-D-alanine carboxypeptidase
MTAKGKANLKTGEKRGLGQPFRIASITKTFTATAVLQLIDEGKLKISDKLSKWYPDIPNADKITIDDLLRMRSGIPDAYDETFFKNCNAHPKAGITARELIERSAKKANQFKPPDQETVYTNINFVLLQVIVRKVSGQPLGDRIDEGILQPLDMNDSFYATDDTLPGTLRGYSWDPKGKEFQDKTVLNPAVPGGAGAMVSTLSDLRPYAKALCEGDLLERQTQKARLRSDAMSGDPDFVRYGQEAVIVIDVSRLDLDDQSKSTEIFLGISKIFFPEYVKW